MKKFLICDNDNDLLELLNMYLKSKGYDFMLVNQGNMVMETLKRNHIQLVFLDLNLADMHGTEIIEQIRKDPQTKDTTIILLTASLRAKRNMDKMNVDGFVEKPFDLKDLDRMIRKKLKK